MLSAVIDFPYWTQLATDTMYSIEQALESKIVGEHKEEIPPTITTNDDVQQIQVVEGSESWVRNLSDQFIFHVSLGYNLANHNQVSQPWWTEITEKKIILGALPFHERKHVERLKSLGVGGVLTLNKPFELQPNLIGTPVQPCDWLLNDVESLHIPTPDFCPPTTKEIKMGIDFMKKIIASGKSVYVHCKAGRGRSVVAVVCYLIETDNITVEEAVEYVKKRRSQINMGKIQLNICYSYYNELHGIKMEPIIPKCENEIKESEKGPEASEHNKDEDCCQKLFQLEEEEDDDELKGLNDGDSQEFVLV